MARCINRAAIVLKPRKPYLDWAAGVDDEAPEHAKDLEKRVSIYLVAEDPAGKEETARLGDYFEEIFETELGAWWTDEKDWPLPRTLKMFQEWFEVTGESVVTDLEDRPIDHEDN